MNNYLKPIKYRFGVVALSAISLISPYAVTAQTFATLHHFTGTTNALPDNEGANPLGALLLSGNALYGTTYWGGNASGDNPGSGTIFKMAADGSAFSVLYRFTATDGCQCISATNSDGSLPGGALASSGDTLYGTTSVGGPFGTGTIYALGTNGTGFRIVHQFEGISLPLGINDGGSFPRSVILSEDTLYGVTSGGGSGGYGTLFSVKTNGSDFITILGFKNGNDGTTPSGLVVSAGTLYGTTRAGGTFGYGTVYRVNVDGTGYGMVHDFKTEGADPVSLALSDNKLYGVTTSGTVFKVNTNGTGFTVLHNFSPVIDPSPTNADGANPQTLIASGTSLYGATYKAGTFGNGTLFNLRTDGSGFGVLHHFTAMSGSSATNTDGAHPFAALTWSNGVIYGTTYEGGNAGAGTAFRLSIEESTPRLSLIGSGTNLTATWLDGSPGFTLQSTVNLSVPVIWSDVLGSTVAGLYVVTNSPSDRQRFFRLSRKE